MTAATHQRHLATAMGALAGSEIFGKVTTLIVFAWCARAIGVEAFGVLSYGLGLGLLIAILPSLGLDSRLIQLIGGDVPSAGVRLASLLVIRCALTVPAILILVPFLTGRPTGDQITIVLMVASAIIDTFADAFRSICVVMNRQHSTAVAHVAQRVSTLLFMTVALLASPGETSAAAAFAGSSVLGVVLMAVMTRRAGVRANFRDLRASHLKALLVSVPVVGGNALAAMALFRVDVILIQAFLGTEAVGQYTVAFRLIETVLFVSWSISRALTPDLARASTTEELNSLVRLGNVLIVAVYVPYGTVLALSGQDLVALIFGADYAVGYLLPWLATTPLLFGLAHFASTVLFARRPNPMVLLAGLAALVVNVLLCLVLLPDLGVSGAAIAKGAAYAIQAAISCWALRQLARPEGVWRGVWAAVGATGLSVLPQVLGLPVLVGVGCAGLVYLLAWYRLSARWDVGTLAWINSLRRSVETP